MSVRPIFSLEFMATPGANDPAELIVTKRQLSSSKKVSEFALSIFESACRDYVFALQTAGEFNKALRSRMTLSSERGLEIETTDEKMLEVVNNAQLPIAVAKKEAKRFKQVKQITPTKEMIEKASQQMSGEAVFFDGVAMSCFTRKIEPVELEVLISGFLPNEEGGGSTTGTLRFPHLLQHLYQTSRQLKNSGETKICIVGPGLKTGECPAAFCPQFVEMFSLFPKARFLLLDHDKEILATLSLQAQSGYCSYDPLMLRMALFPPAHNPCKMPARYKPMLRTMAAELAKRATELGSQKMLAGQGSAFSMHVGIETGQLEIKNFDILKSSFEPRELQSFDIIVATLSISVAIQSALETTLYKNYFGELLKFLQALKAGGTLYMDVHVIGVLQNAYGTETVEFGFQYMEAMLGHQLILQEIPLSDFVPEERGSLMTIQSFSIEEARKERYGSITTSSLIAITKSLEKTALSKEQSLEISLKLLTGLKEFAPARQEGHKAL